MRIVLTILLSCACIGVFPWVASGQLTPPTRARVVPATEAAVPAATSEAARSDKEEPKGKEQAESGDSPPAPRRPAPPPLDPRYVRLHLLDGSVIAGNLSITALPVDTPFGKLSVPIASIRSFVPGLKSHPQLMAEVEKLIEDLGSDDFKTREAAHRELSQRGRTIRRMLESRSDDGSAERRRHLQQLVRELEEQAEVGGDDESATRPLEWIADDTIETQQFTMVGTITTKEFQIESKYGPLTVKLADVVRGEREVAGRDAYRKVVQVLGNNLVQRGFKATGIRVEAGDRITFKASGQVMMTPWGGGQVSTPDGSPQYGWLVPNEIPGGSLVAKIGENGKVQKVGSRATIVAKSSGILHLAMAMAAEYSQEGYQFPGQYEVTVKVEPQ